MIDRKVGFECIGIVCKVNSDAAHQTYQFHHRQKPAGRRFRFGHAEPDQSLGWLASVLAGKTQETSARPLVRHTSIMFDF